MDRREFLQIASAASVFLLAPNALHARSTGAKPSNTLVLIQLAGGNDGLNTVVPFGDKRYYDLRPNIAIERNQALHLSSSLGLNPNMDPLMSLWKEKDMAVVLGVGYPNPNRSHFRSIEIWQTATDSHKTSTQGWLTNALDTHKNNIAEGILVGDEEDGPFAGSGIRAVNMTDPRAFIRAARQVGPAPKTKRATNSALRHLLHTQHDLHTAADRLEDFLDRAPSLGVSFPKTPLGRKLEIVAHLIAAGVPVPVLKVSHGGFDTHAGQPGKHNRLLKQLSEAVSAFSKALKKQNRWDDTLVMTYSEFGRRPGENASKGTDHGTSAPHFLFGGRVRGGLHGKQPSLSDLASKDLKHHVDFRSLYTTISQHWWKLPPSKIPTRAHKALNIIS